MVVCGLTLAQCARLLRPHLRWSRWRGITSFVDVSKRGPGVAVLTMQRSPVNSLNTEFLQALTRGIKDLVSNPLLPPAISYLTPSNPQYQKYSSSTIVTNLIFLSLSFEPNVSAAQFPS